MKMLITIVSFLLLPFTTFAHPGHEGGHLVFAKANLHAHLSWDQGPDANGGESKMRVEWHDGTTHAVVEPNLPFGVSLWMPSMGHGSAPTQLQRVTDANGNVIVGVYQVTNMYFVMSGAWDIRVAIKNADGSEETEAWSITVEGGDHGGGHHH